MKSLQRLLFFCFTLACAAAAHADETSPSLVSFADLYRITVTGRIAMYGWPAALSFAEATPEPQLRVAALSADALAEPRFTISPVPGPGRWMLLLAGVAAFGWVAHRRLSRAL